jgi:hypothetical protein
MHEGPLTLILFVLCPIRVLQCWRCSVRGRDGGRWPGDPGKHWNDDRVVAIEFGVNLVDGGASELSDVLDHLVVVVLKV